MVYKEITSDYVDRASVDGVHDVKRSKRCKRVFWVIMCLLIWAVVVFQCYGNIAKYLSYPKTTTIEIKSELSALFPAVTVCNLNPVRYGFLESSYGASDAKQFSRDLNQTGKLDKYDNAEWDTDMEFVDEGMTYENILRRTFYEQMYMTPIEDVKNAGHQLKDMLLECTWQQDQCYPDDFYQFVHPIYGNCFTFNSGQTDTEAVKTTILPGPDYGLVLTFFIEEDEYVPSVTSSSGMRVHIHNQSYIPYPYDSGFTASPGFSTSYELHKIDINRLGAPYNAGGCRSTIPSIMSKIDQIWPKAGYNLHSCSQFCYEEKLLATCGCIDARIPFIRGKVPCHVENADEEKCRITAENSYRNATIGDECQAICTQACSELSFAVTPSYSKWPNDYYMEILNQTYAKRNEKLRMLMHAPVDMTDRIRENILQIKIYFDSPNYESITEEEEYTLDDANGDIGGNLGLWVGMSVLSIVQFFEFLFEIFYYCVRRRRFNHAEMDKVQPGTTELCESRSARRRRSFMTNIGDPPVSMTLYPE